MKTLTPDQQQLLEDMRPVFDQYILELAAMKKAEDAEIKARRDQVWHNRRIADLEYWAQENQRRDTLLANWVAAKEQGLIKNYPDSDDPIVLAQQEIEIDAENALYFPGMHSTDISILKYRYERQQIEAARQAIEAQELPQ